MSGTVQDTDIVANEDL